MAQFEGYIPIFELGVCEEDPAVLVLDAGVVPPVLLAALVTALFETVMTSLPDDEQISYEQQFRDSFDILMKERFDYNVEKKFLEDDNE